MTGVEEGTQALTRTLLLVGGLAMLVLVAIAFVIVRRGLLPLERIAGTAQDIAAGDLSHRAGVPHDDTEVGRLGAAFDTMLDRIESSFAAQQAALDEKARSEDQLRRFVSDASHELRTPLTAVRGYADLYRAGGLADPADLERAMDRIGTESRRMALLVDDLLLLARLDQGRPLRADRVDLSRLVRDAVDDARAVEPARPIGGSVADGIAVHRRRGPHPPGDRQPARERPRAHQPIDAGRGRRSRRPTTAPSSGSWTTARGSTASTGPACSTGSIASIPAVRGTAAGRASDCRSSRRSPHALGGRLWHEATPGGGATFVVRLPLTASSQPDHRSDFSHIVHRVAIHPAAVWPRPSRRSS